jgi:hypothetical protein
LGKQDTEDNAGTLERSGGLIGLIALREEIRDA